MRSVLRPITALVALACLLNAGVAQAACPNVMSRQVFSGFGDSSWYSAVPGGTFEAGTPAWTHSGTQVVTGNEPYYVNAPNDRLALGVPTKTSALSPYFCVGMEHPTLRLFARKPAGSGGVLKVEILYPNGSSTNVKKAGMLENGKNDAYADWKLSPPLDLAIALPFSSSTQTMQVRLRVSADQGGDWVVDDVFYDPYRGG